MIASELRELLKDNKRYKDFIILDQPVNFKEEFADKNIDIVQLHSIQICNHDSKDIVGFCGQCSWKDNKLLSLDQDSYCENMTVYGYHWWSNPEYHINVGLDILVGDDW